MTDWIEFDSKPRVEAASAFAIALQPSLGRHHRANRQAITNGFGAVAGIRFLGAIDLFER